MGAFDEVSVRQYICTPQVHEVRSFGKFPGQFPCVVLRSGTERPGAKSESVVRVVDGMEYPCDVYFVGYDAGKTQYLEGGSSGCTHIFMPNVSHTGMMADKKYRMFSRRAARSMPS